MSKKSLVSVMFCLLIVVLLNGVVIAVEPPVVRSGPDRYKDLVLTEEEILKETETKIERVRKYLDENKLDGILMIMERNFNWITAGGHDDIVLAQKEGIVKVLITRKGKYLIAANDESARILEEEVKGQGYKLKEFIWYEGDAGIIKKFTDKLKIGSDASYPGTVFIEDFHKLWYPLTETEIKKYRWLGAKTAEILENVARELKQGESEIDLKHRLAKEYWMWDIFPTVLLLGVDGRLHKYRHVIATDKKLDRFAMLNVCTRKWGLIIACTRFVHFGPLPEDLEVAFKKCAKVDAAMQYYTKPGVTCGEVFERIKEAYTDVGYPDEWKAHHQGGPLTYLERDYLAKPDSKELIYAGQAVAWNPTLNGAKIEDTILVREDGALELLTPCVDWPMIAVKYKGKTYKRPGVLIR